MQVLYSSVVTGHKIIYPQHEHQKYMNPTAILFLLFSTAPRRSIWYRLIDSLTGQSYKATSADANVVDFREAVKGKNPNTLSSFDAANLVVYKNKESFEKRNEIGNKKEEPLEEDSLICHFGMSKNDALIVLIPSLLADIVYEPRLSWIKKPNPHRKERWDQLNEVFESNTKTSSRLMGDSTTYSSVTWGQVKDIFKPSIYVQPRLEIDDNTLDILVEYLSRATMPLGFIHTGKEVQRLHFIAPILVCVCSLFKGDVDIVVEEDLKGESIKAHGHFEFMLRRGNKVVCIVEAKRDDLEQGIAQDLVGCEVAADVGGLNVVYGIVTNYIEWIFLRSLDEKIEWEGCSLFLEPYGPHKDSLKKIAEKIYAMLSYE